MTNIDYLFQGVGWCPVQDKRNEYESPFTRATWWQFRQRQIRKIHRNLAAQLNEIERQHTDEVLQQQDKRRQAAEREADRKLADKRRQIAEIVGYEDQLVSGIIRGRQSLGQIVSSIAIQVVEREIQADLRYATEHRMMTAAQLARDESASRGGMLLHLLAGRQKVASTFATEGAQTAAVASGEAARTGAAVVGNTVRAAAATAGAAQTAAVTSLTNKKSVMSDAAAGAASAYKALAGVPVIGPILGAAAAVATFAGIAAFESRASFEVGANVLPSDMIAQVHAGERIIPAADNARLISLVEAGAGRGGDRRGGDIHMHYAPTITGDVNKKTLDAHSRELLGMLRKAVRNGAI